MKYDIVATDARGRDVLAVMTAARPQTADELGALYEYVRGGPIDFPFIMIVDPDSIWLFDDQGHRLCQLETPAIMKDYEPGFEGPPRKSRFYLAAVADAWLSDLAYRWRRSSNPPALDRLEPTGLLARLTEGDTRTEVVVDADPVR